jgi:hypothetical protein
MVCLDWLKQLDSRLRIDNVIMVYDGLQASCIGRTIDIQALPTSIATNLAILAAFDPSVTGYRIMMGMSGIHEINRVFGALLALSAS